PRRRRLGRPRRAGGALPGRGSRPALALAGRLRTARARLGGARRGRLVRLVHAGDGQALALEGRAARARPRLRRETPRPLERARALLDETVERREAARREEHGLVLWRTKA